MENIFLVVSDFLIKIGNFLWELGFIESAKLVIFCMAIIGLLVVFMLAVILGFKGSMNIKKDYTPEQREKMIKKAQKIWEEEQMIDAAEEDDKNIEEEKHSSKKAIIVFLIVISIIIALVATHI